jgi:hypothetical protein
LRSHFPSETFKALAIILKCVIQHLTFIINRADYKGIKSSLLPTLTCFNVSNKLNMRFCYWYSFSYFKIALLHTKFYYFYYYSRLFPKLNTQKLTRFFLVEVKKAHLFILYTQLLWITLVPPVLPRVLAQVLLRTFFLNICHYHFKNEKIYSKVPSILLHNIFRSSVKLIVQRSLTAYFLKSLESSLISNVVDSLLTQLRIIGLKENNTLLIT